MYRVLLPAMGCHLFKLTPQFKLLLLCFVFLSNLSVSIMFSVSGHLADSEDLDTNLHADNLAEDYDFEEQELESFKKTMMDGLGFRKVPDVTKMNVSQDEYARMYDVYLRRLEQTQMDDSSHTQNVPKFHTFHLKEHHVRRKRRRGVTQLVFNVSAEASAETSVDHATLRLLASGASVSGPVRVRVLQVLGRGRARLVSERDVHLAADAPKWVELDVTTAVRNWLEHAEPNLGLELHCAECARLARPLLADSPHTPPAINALLASQNPSIDFDTDGGRDKRSAEQMLFYQKNQSTNCNNKNHKRCCRHKMEFDLSQVGFDFIIAPKKYDGGICKGRCPPRYNAAHNHAVLQSMMNKRDKNLMPRVCCASSKLTHLEVLMMDDDKPGQLIVKQWENMVVVECACT